MKVIAYDANFGNTQDSVIDQFQQVLTYPVGTNGQEIVIVHPRPSLEPTTFSTFEPSANKFGLSFCVSASDFSIL